MVIDIRNNRKGTLLWRVLWAKNHLKNLIEIKQIDSKNRSNFSIDQIFRSNFSIDQTFQSIEFFNRSKFSIDRKFLSIRFTV